MVDGLLKSFDEFRNGCDEKLRYVATVSALVTVAFFKINVTSVACTGGVYITIA